MKRSPEWFDRQLAHARACLAEADRKHTPEEIAAAMAALGLGADAPQGELDLSTDSVRSAA